MDKSVLISELKRMLKYYNFLEENNKLIKITKEIIYFLECGAFIPKQSNADKIRSMTDEELANDRIASIIDGEDVNIVLYYTTNGCFETYEEAFNDELNYLREKC